ncbi:MAG: serine hydrolase domain-containing protein [Sphingomicrobium sp.]
MVSLFGNGIAVAAAAPPARHLPAPAVTASDEAIGRFFDSYMTTTMKRLGIPGGAVVVVRDGRQILARGYGFSDVKARRPVDLDRTLFRAASASKILPWLLVMQLVEEKRIDLDADVNRYLDFKLRYRFGKPITMRHLMTHSAGFAERFHGVFDQDLSQPLGAALRDNVPRQVYTPGTTIAYSNYGAALAGYIVQRLRHRPWADIVAQRIFRPVGMTGSTVAQPVPVAMQSRLSATYSFGSDKPGPFRFTPLAPMGSLTPTAADMGRLLMMLSRNGAGERGRVISPATLNQMFALQQPLAPGLPDGFGLGFLTGRYRGVHYAGHAGNMSELATDVELLPEAGLGWYYVFNSQGDREGARPVRMDLIRKAVDALVAHDTTPLRALPGSNAPELEGKYSSSRRLFSGPLMFSGMLDTTDVQAESDGSLSISSGGELSHWLPHGRDRFVNATSGIPLAVTRDRAGRVWRIASAELYPAAVFERASALVVIVPIVAAGAFCAYLLYLLTRGAGWARSRFRRKAAKTADAKVMSRDWVGRGRRLALWLVPVVFVTWAAFAVALAIDFTIMFTAPRIIPPLLGLLVAALAPAAAVLALFAVRNWADRSWRQRVGDGLVTLATTGFAALAYTLDLVNMSGSW